MAFNFGTSILPTNDNTFSLGSASRRWKINDQEITFDTIYPIGAIYISVSNIDPGTLFGGTWEAIGGQFLIGANSSYTAGDTGGSATMTHTHTMAHTHTMSHTHSQVATTSGGPSNNTSGSTAITVAQMPSHSHDNQPLTNSDQWPYYDTIGAWSGSYTPIIKVSSNTNRYLPFNSFYNSSTGGGEGHTHTLSSHTHSTSATTTGGASNATTSAASNATTSEASNTNNMPPYLVVYIWKRVA